MPKLDNWLPHSDNWLPRSDNWLTESDNWLPESDNCTGNTVVDVECHCDNHHRKSFSPIPFCTGDFLAIISLELSVQSDVLVLFCTHDH